MQFKDVQCPLERRGMPYFCFFTCIARPCKTAVYDKLCMVIYCICIAYALHMFKSHNCHRKAAMDPSGVFIAGIHIDTKTIEAGCTKD